MNIDTESILLFWFGDKLDEPAELKQRFKRWFSVDPVFDAEIRERFGATVMAADHDELREWARTPRDALAVILLLDQFPRNIFRGSAKAFMFDDGALGCCRDGIARGLDLNLNTIERTFFYLPLEHAEDLAAQRSSVAQYTKLLETTAGEFAEFAKTNLAYAREHLALIKRFSRFPHRNDILGRASSDDELVFLATNGKQFGQA